MIKPGMKNPPYEIELTDSRSRRKYGLKVPQGSLQIGTISQDDTVYLRNVGKRVGDFDEQRSWKGGRGADNFSEASESFWDSENLWTLSANHLHQGLQWYHARGLRSEDMYMPTRSAGNVTFQPLLGDALYISSAFAASATYSADKAYLWVRRRGTPGNLTFRLHSDSGGDPDTVLKTVVKTTNDITDYISIYEVFDWTGTESLTSGTTYHVSVYGASTDDIDSHWEIGVNASTEGSKQSSDDSTWSNASFSMYYRVTDADTNRTWFRFYLSDAFYIVDKKDSGAASVMYINGDRGKATSGTASTLVDSVKSWTANRWRNAWVKITKGTGIGQTREIASNTSTTLTLSEDWITTPSTDSEFVIYATEWFTQITFSGGSPTLSAVTGEPAVANNVAYIPQGTAVILHMQWNASTKAHDGYAETAATTQGLAHLLIVANDTADGPVIWRANNTSTTGSGGNVTVSRANLLSSGSYIAWNTSLTFLTSIKTGSSSYRITGLGRKDNQVYVFREDGMGLVSNDRYTNVETGIEKTPSPANGLSNIAHGQFLYYSWLHSLVRVYGSTHDDIGDDYRGSGLPDGREGNYSDMETYLKLLFCAIDADAGTSSVLAWDGMGWHEMLRGIYGRRIRFCKVQTCPDTRNRLWSDMGGDLVFQELPLKRAAPRLDSGARYMHEAVLTSAAIDMGAASGLPKFIKDLTITVSSLNTTGRAIYIDFQTDDDIETNNWTNAGVVTESPESVLFLGLENIRRFAYRLRICCDNNSIPIDITGVVPNGYARTPFKMVFTMQVQAGGIYTRKGKTASSDELMRWLLDASRQPGRVQMSSVYHMAHGWHVVVHPPRQFPVTPKKGNQPETASMTLVLQEV